MAKLVKEDEKNERIIRGLLKLPENRRCINCDSLEFTHRVKSISMANFSAHEVSDLEGGGNERAKEFYFKEWDPQRQSVPARSDIERLRDFIKHVYVDRRYTGESSNYKPSRTMTVEWEDSYTNRSGFGSPFYDDMHEWHYSERSMSGGRNDETYSRYNYDERSPVYDQDNQRYPECRRSISSFQVVDHRSCDRSGSRKHEGNRSSNGEPANLEGRSLDHEKDTSILPVMHSVQDIWEQFPTLRIGIQSKAISDGASDDAAQMQRTASSSSIGSIDGNVVEIKREDSRSLINFNANPKPAQQNQGTSSSAGQSMIKLTNSFTDNNWVAFDSSNEEKICQDASDGKIMGSKWSVPAAAPVRNMSMFPVTGNVCTEHIHNIRALPIGGASATASILPRGGSASAPAVASSGTSSLLPIGSGDSFRKTNDTRQWPSMEQHHNSKFPNTASLSTAEKFVPSISVGSKNR
ncbi:probable ADP-ribosylation factor GTPase-activating protein AGD14 [Fagus crenata]